MAAVDRTELESCGSTSTWPAGWACCTRRCARGRSSGPSCTYRGEVARRSTRLITAAFAAGLLEYRLDQNVNIVNAELLARERGIEIVEQTSSQEGRFQHAHHAPTSSPTRRPTPPPARCSATSTCGWCSWGRTTSTPIMDGVMLIFTHRDVPGLIGFIGTIFGKHQVNIAQMTVGRQQPGGEAIAVLNLDSPPPEEALDGSARASADQQRERGQLPPAGQMPPWFG